jgi:LysR family transcriptional regulator, regulator for bpeEF and oprC
MVGEDQAWLVEAAAAGIGVLRSVDLTLPRYISSGRLIPALTDWESLEAPMIFAAYPPSQRRSRLVRAFLDFLIQLFAEIETERSQAIGSAISRVRKPEWYGRTHGRQSAYGSRGRKGVA